MAIIYQVKYKVQDPYYRCDNQQCGNIAAGRRELVDGQEVVQPPKDWLIPRRSREMMNPQVTHEVFCSWTCLAEHDNFPVPNAAPAAPAPRVETATEMPEIVTARR